MTGLAFIGLGTYNKEMTIEALTAPFPFVDLDDAFRQIDHIFWISRPLGRVESLVTEEEQKEI